MGKCLDLKSEFKVEYVPLPPERMEAHRAALLLLLRWVDELRVKEKKVAWKLARKIKILYRMEVVEKLMKSKSAFIPGTG